MATFVALLRGVNVAGKGKLRMAALRETCEARGLTKVGTYLQSGNLVFDCKLTSVNKVVAMVEELLESQVETRGDSLVVSQREVSKRLRTNKTQ